MIKRSRESNKGAGLSIWNLLAYLRRIIVCSEWGIENGLHYSRDVTIQEDLTRVTDKKMERAMEIINNME